MYRPVLTRLTLRMGLLTMLALIAACGGRPEENEPRPLPEAEGQALRPGEYRSEEFEPPLTFRVGEGWALYTPEAPEVLRIERGETGGLGFTNIREVYEPTKTGSPDVVDAPEDIVGWFRRHPYLRTTNLEPATVGGVEGVRFDVVVGELPEGYHGVCLAIIGSDCVDIARFSDGQMLFHTKGTKARVIVLEDVEGETVTHVLWRHRHGVRRARAHGAEGDRHREVGRLVGAPGAYSPNVGEGFFCEVRPNGGVL